MRRAGMVVLTLALAASEATAQRAIDETRSVRADGRVEIENLAGSVRVVGWNRDEVQVTGTLAPRAERLDFTTSGSVTRIEVVFPRQRNLNLSRGEGESDLEIRVPASSRLEVETVSADIEVEQVSGALELESVSGRVSVRGTSGQVVDAESVSGTVEVIGPVRELDASSVSGVVRVNGVRGTARAETVSGAVEVTNADLREGTFKAVSGTVRYEGAISGGSFNFESFSGGVVLVVPASVNATFDVSTFSGDIRSDFEAEVRRARYSPEREAHFTVGSGAARVKASSFSGTVEIRRR